MESGVTTIGTASQEFTDVEHVALRERAHEQKAAGRRGPRAGTAAGERAGRAKIAALPEADKEQGYMSTIRCEATLCTIGSWTLLRLPKRAATGSGSTTPCATLREQTPAIRSRS